MNQFDGKTEQDEAFDCYDPKMDSWKTFTFKPDGVEGPEARSASTLLPLIIDGRDDLVTTFGEWDPGSLGNLGAETVLYDV